MPHKQLQLLEPQVLFTNSDTLVSLRPDLSEQRHLMDRVQNLNMSLALQRVHMLQ